MDTLEKELADIPQIRVFATGATRDTEDGKIDPEGFLSPVVIQRFSEYMHENRMQKDGSLRSSSNWQLGIPREAYIKSLWRHLLTLWKIHRKQGFLSEQRPTRKDLEDALCAIIFNAQGYLFEVLNDR